MIIYEVTAKVGSHLTDEFERYMRDQHIPDVLGTGAFRSASFSVSEGGGYQIRYEAKGPDDLDRYIDESAPLLRKDVQDRFPTGLELTRNVWSTIRTWKC
jgi:hypothetical protein